LTLLDAGGLISPFPKAKLRLKLKEGFGSAGDIAAGLGWYLIWKNTTKHKRSVGKCFGSHPNSSGPVRHVTLFGIWERGYTYWTNNPRRGLRGGDVDENR
jgi:hypothetical protein